MAKTVEQRLDAIEQKLGMDEASKEAELIAKYKRQFKPGDRVRCLLGGGSSWDVTGDLYSIKKVELADVSHADFVYVEGSNRVGGVFAWRFELVEEPAKKPARKLQVGDYVRCIHAGQFDDLGDASYTLEDGKVYRIASLPNKWDLKPEGLSSSWDRRRFELVDEPPRPPKLMIGDRVKVVSLPEMSTLSTQPAGLPLGSIQEVSSVTSDGTLVTLRDNAGGWWDTRRFELVKEEPAAPKTEPKPDPSSTERPRVSVLGWPNSDGTFTLILDPNPQGHGLSANDNLVYYTVVPNDRAVIYNLGIDNLKTWYDEQVSKKQK